ncbi:MAG TPA: tRNA pseudouridine(55) synthase TruB [Candidatus Anoxymicrobiaceae bacterium]
MPPVGVLIVDKPVGITSRKAVSEVGGLAGAARSGHAGTLDPLATGVLVVCLGRATLLSSYLAGGTKVYLVTAILGMVTDSYDLDGAVVAQCDASECRREDIKNAASAFVGTMEQLPPAYSAVKFQGRPLYHYARLGTEVERKPRTVSVDSIDILSMGADEEGVKAGFRITCGPGTYIRSLIHDIGDRLGCGATVSALRRVRSGDFDIDRAIPLERFSSGRFEVADALISMEAATAGFPSATVVLEGELPVRQGKPLELSMLKGPPPDVNVYRVMSDGGSLLALYGPPRLEDGAEVMGRAVRVIRASTLEMGDDEASKTH